MDFYDLLQNHAAVFLLLVCRASGLFMISPFFGSLNVPVYFRAGTCLALSVVLFPVVDGFTALQAPPTVLMYTAAVLQEIFVGWLIGFVSYISFSAIQMAGKVMDMQVGFSIVNVMDPTSGQQAPLIGSFLYNLSVIVLLVTNGHHMLLTALVESFRTIPLTGISFDASLTELIARFTTGIFLTGVQIALPITFSILLTNVSLGILARTMPSLNIFVVGIPLQIMIGMFVLLMVIPFYVLFLDVLFNEMYGNIDIALRTLR
ncbi:MAG: flagellar biosynthetic protein FliR [Negativicutes bacterium]